MRDLRRATVALSRARLGLYILGRKSVFESVFELQPAFEKLFARPTSLQLVTGEMYPTVRPVDTDVPSVEMADVEHLGQFVFQMTNTRIKMLKDGVVGLPPPAGEQEDVSGNDGVEIEGNIDIDDDEED
jgi:intron-binding protein aquarius